jgi:hypothetical protein
MIFVEYLALRGLVVLPEYWTQLAVGLTLAAITVLYFGCKPEILRAIRGGMITHPEVMGLLRQTFQKWLSVYLLKGESGISVIVGTPDDPETFRPVDNLQHIDRAKAYLKAKHREIYDDWIETNTLVAKYNDLAPKRNELLTAALRSQMKTAYSTLAESPPSVENNYYDLPLLIQAFNGRLAEPHGDGWKRRLYSYPHAKQDGRPSTLKSHDQTLISSDDVSDVQLEKLERIFDEVMHNSEFMNTNNELVALEKKAQARRDVFRTNLQKLCEKIEFREE